MTAAARAVLAAWTNANPGREGTDLVDLVERAYAAGATDERVSIASWLGLRRGLAGLDDARLIMRGQHGGVGRVMEVG